ncbi:MAG: DegT/DnrJ/EryC1/StrS family aminotransferase [Deltaproteobacteria bacterium]|nr:DegT/DnrJ/EryC1/StrS family aminotransferase [Deltaproteobacteria bacterium]
MVKGVKVPFVDLRAQYIRIKDEIDAAITDVIGDTAFIGGKYVSLFEEAFASFCGARYCIGVGNGTDAINITLRALGIGRGDEVITVANSFIATAEAVTMTGARVVFVDCDPHTYNLDVEKVARAVTPRTKAIVPVHLYGQPANMLPLKEIAEEYGLSVIEDAAQAHGAEINGRRVGTFGQAGCFSFYPGKNLGAYGDAGAIVTDQESLAMKCRMIANHGRISKYDHDFEGVNSRLDGMQAAILHVKLKHLEKWTEQRREAAARYRELLSDTPALAPNEAESMRHVYHLFVVRLSNRDAIMAGLKDQGIVTGVHYPIALPNLRAYRYLGYAPDDFPFATRYSGEILSLPMFPELSNDQIAYVCYHMKNLLKS